MNDSFTRQLCLSVDVQGYGRGNDLKQSEIQEELISLLDTAARSAGLDRESWTKQQQGDGELSLIPSGEPENRVIDQFMGELATLLYRRNSEKALESRLRLRLAVDHGPVKPAPMGYTGGPVVAVSRLINSTPARQALAKAPEGNIVIVLSQRIYKDLVMGGHTSVQPSRFLRVSVREKEYADDAWLWMPGIEVETLRQVLADSEYGQESAMCTGFAAVMPEVQRLQAILTERSEGSVDVKHTLEMFRQVVEFVDIHTPVTAYGEASQVALGYVLAESSIVHSHATQLGPEAEFGSVVKTKRDLDTLAESVSGIEVTDFDAVRRLVNQVSLIEPERLKRVTGLQNSPAARCFGLLWGLARLAQLLDNPSLMDAELPPTVAPRRNIISVRDGGPDGSVFLDLATTERTGFHLAAEAHHTVRRYFAELEDVWRLSHLIPPTIRVELCTPNWIGRSLQVHEIRVDPRPITRLLMGRSLYGDRQHVWLRELIQNAVDATEMGTHGNTGYVPKVEVELEDPHHVTLRDNGIGMTYQQVLTQLSVLGRSGWRDSTAGEGVAEANAFFGRFGIGFASVFGVASSVDVHTRTADARPTDGIAVRFSGPDRPFFTDFVSCPVGTEIRISLIDAMNTTEFREAMADLFAYLPSCIYVSPDIRLPGSLRDFSSLARDKRHCNGWSVLERSGTTRLGPYSVGFKLEVLHDLKPHKRKDRYYTRPSYTELGYTAVTFCVDGVRINQQQGVQPIKPGDQGNRSRRERERDLYLSGCYLTVDFGRNNAPVMASRNALDIDEELQREVEQLIKSEVGGALPGLIQAAQSTCITNRARHDAGYRVLEDLLIAPENYSNRRTDFHNSSEMVDAAAVAYRLHCPVLVKSQDGKSHYSLLADVDPNECSVAITESLTTHAVFPAFVRATGLLDWLVVSGKRELSLLEQAWPYDAPLRLVDEATQLYEDFQTVLPEIREGHVWQLLRADYALSEGSVFGSSLCLALPGRKGAVARDVGLARRRFEASATERPRIVLNRNHEVIAVIEDYLEQTGEAGVAPIRDWLDRFCKDVLDEKSLRAVNVLLPQLREQLSVITGTRLSRLSVADLRVS